MLKIKRIKLKLIILGIIIFTFTITGTIEAIVISNENNTKVINDISVSASTGGNQADSGEVVEGQAESSVKVKTIINDQVVEDIDIEETTAGGDASVKVESRVQADNDKAIVETTTVINDEETIEKQIIDLAGEESVPTLFSENVQATSVGSAELNESEEETASNTEETGTESPAAPTENIIAKIFINIFNIFKAGILKIFSIFS